MAYTRPTFDEILGRVRQDIRDRTEGGDSFLRRSVEGVLALVIAALVHGLYGFLKWISRQIIPTTADEDMAVKWAEFFGLDRKQPTKATGTATFEGTNTTVVPEGTELGRSDGVLYLSTADATVTGGEVTVPFEAVEAGSEGNCLAGTAIRISSPIAGVDSEGTVDDAITDGTDLESPADLKARLAEYLDDPELGGGPGDYIDWALEVPGVTRAWEFPAKDGPGTVGVAIVDDTLGDITDVPTGVVDAVDAKFAAEAPITATATAFTPTALEVDVTVSISPDTSAIREAVEAELADLFKTSAQVEEDFPRSWIGEAISRATGEVSHTLTAPAADVTVSSEELPVLGMVTFV